MMNSHGRTALGKGSLVLVATALASICGVIAWTVRDSASARPLETSPASRIHARDEFARLQPASEVAQEPLRAQPSPEPVSVGPTLHGIVRADGKARAAADVLVTHFAPDSANENPPPMWRLKSDEAGRFAFVDAPITGSLRVDAVARGFARARVVVTVLTEDVVLELVPLPEPFARVHGVVVNADGTQAARVRVALGHVLGATDREGKFELEIEAPDPEADLVAATAGSEAAIQRGYGASVRQGTNPPVRLVLGGPCRSISGKVLDNSGAPLKNWKVAIDGYDPAGLALGRETARTNSAGEFHIGSISTGTYSIRAWARRRDDGVRIDRVEAGANGIEIRMP